MYNIQDLQAIAVLYKVRISDCTSLISLNKSLNTTQDKLSVFIYDNSPEAQLVPYTAFPNLHLEYLHDPTNPGVSKAYNIGVANAKESKKKFVLLVDQDTEFPMNCISKYLEGVNSYSEKLFCPILKASDKIYSPTKYFFRRGQHWNEVKPGVYSLTNRSALNSGLLIETDAFQAVGGYKNEIELYFSDFEFINRFRDFYKTFVVLDIVCFHSLSDIDLTDYPNALRRFGYYVSGSFNSSNGITDYLYLFFTVFGRAIKLTLRYKRAKFFKLFFKQYIFAANLHGGH